MQLASSARIPDGFMAAMRLGGEKPHQGLPDPNPGLYQGPTVCNSTTALGLQAAAVLNRIGSCSTGKERDAESGLDYFGARYYASAMGRFMSPDWSAKAMPVPYANLLDPQSLNLYAYVNNNPLLKADPDGHCDWCQKVVNKLSGNGWKTDEQVAQKGVNNNVVLVRTSMVDGAKVGDLKGVFHVTYTPTKIENGELKGPVSADPKDPNVKVSLWESQGGGSYENMDPKSGPSVGQGHDNISTGMGMLSPDVDQHWSVNGERVQMVVGTDSQTGKPILTWQDHVDRSGDTPKITGVPNAKP